jgi:hypothetical protein
MSTGFRIPNWREKEREEKRELQDFRDWLKRENEELKKRLGEKKESS